MSLKRNRRLAPAATFLVVLLMGCGCGDERETRRIDLGIRPEPERAATPGSEPVPGETVPGEPVPGEPVPGETPSEPSDASAPITVETAVADAEGGPAATLPDGAAPTEPEPTAATAGDPAAGVGAPP